MSQQNEVIQLRIDPTDRKIPISVSFHPAKYALVDKSIQLGSFSAKIDQIITEWFEIKSILVMYEDSEQREHGEPTLCNARAERIFCMSEVIQGWTFTDTKYEKEVQRILRKAGYQSPAYPKSEKIIKSKIVPLLRDGGFIVQIVDEIEYDLFEIWVSHPLYDLNKMNCAQCIVIKQIADYLQKIQGDEEKDIS
jgi:hypothetical protein